MELTGITTKAGGVVSIHKYKDSATKAYTTNLFGGRWLIITEPKVVELLETLEKERFNEAKYKELLSELVAMDSESIIKSAAPYRRERSKSGSTPKIDSSKLEDKINPDTGEVIEKADQKLVKLNFCQKLTAFFSEFCFKPGARFTNTLAYKCKLESKDSASEYVANYLKLMDSCDKNSVIDKMKSPEWDEVLNSAKPIIIDNLINKRLQVLFGPQGTGKSTEALCIAPGAAVIVCNSCMLPDDLMQDFDFNDETGKPVFKKSSLRLAMEEGKKIILDEINLLPFETLRFMQGVTDDKPYINYKGEVINITSGFEVIGTMNLEVNGQVFNLPEPLVDRCHSIKELVLPAAKLAAISF